MQYDDPQRPQYDSGGNAYPLHLSGAPMPSITMLRPMQSEGPEEVTFTDVDGTERTTRGWVWGWLCCIHAARGQNSFSHYYGWIRNMGAFQHEFLLDPEAALLKYFKWKGMEKEKNTPATQQVIEDDIFAE